MCCVLNQLACIVSKKTRVMHGVEVRNFAFAVIGCTDTYSVPMNRWILITSIFFWLESYHACAQECKYSFQYLKTAQTTLLRDVLRAWNDGFQRLSVWMFKSDSRFTLWLSTFLSSEIHFQLMVVFDKSDRLNSAPENKRGYGLLDLHYQPSQS